MRRKVWFGVLAGLALAGAVRPEPLLAEGLPVAAPAASAWTFDGGLYAWALWVEGDATARGETFNVYADPIDLIDALDGPIIMANFEARRDRFALYTDIVYADFGLDSDFVGEAQPIPQLTLKGDGRIGADYKFGVYQTEGFYQIANFAGANGNTTIELGGGARYIEQKISVTAGIDLSARTQLKGLLDRVENRIGRIQNQAERLAALAQLNALREELLEERIMRTKDKGLKRRVARLENRLKNVDNRGEAIAALEALDKFRLALLKKALNLGSNQFNDKLAFVNSGNINWVDPVIALRMTHNFGKGKSITAMGDFGGFNVEDGLSWQVVLTYDYEGTLFGYETTTSLGYKALWLQFEEETSNGAHGIDVVLHGPVAELSLRW